MKEMEEFTQAESAEVMRGMTELYKEARRTGEAAPENIRRMVERFGLEKVRRAIAGELRYLDGDDGRISRRNYEYYAGIPACTLRSKDSLYVGGCDIHYANLDVIATEIRMNY
jgi:hypothetical protein